MKNLTTEQTESLSLREGEFVLAKYEGRDNHVKANNFALNKAIAFMNHKFRCVKLKDCTLVLSIPIECLFPRHRREVVAL